MAHALATTAQLANRLGRAITNTAQAEQALEEATDVVETFIGWPLEAEPVEVTVYPRARTSGPIYLPHRVQAVAGVTVAGEALQAGSWTFDAASHTLTLPLGFYASHVAVVVTGTSGFAPADIPPTLRSVVLSVAARTLTNPAGGIRSESLSDHAITFAGDDPTGGAYLTEKEQDLIDQTGLRDWAFG